MGVVVVFHVPFSPLTFSTFFTSSSIPHYIPHSHRQWSDHTSTHLIRLNHIIFEPIQLNLPSIGFGNGICLGALIHGALPATCLKVIYSHPTYNFAMVIICELTFNLFLHQSFFYSFFFYSISFRARIAVEVQPLPFSIFHHYHSNQLKVSIASSFTSSYGITSSSSDANQ